MPLEASRNRQELGKVTKYSGTRWPHFVSDVRDPRACRARAQEGNGPLTVHHLNQLLLVCSLVLLIAVAAVRISSRSGLPSLLVYLGIGIAMGQDGIGDIHFDNAELTQVIGYAALVVILAEGGLGTQWEEIQPVLPVASALALAGVGLRVGATAAAA